MHVVAPPVWTSVSLPSAQGMQPPTPSAGWYRATSQLMHVVVPSVLYWPATQSAHGVVDTVETCPATQAWQTFPPVLPFVGASE